MEEDLPKRGLILGCALAQYQKPSIPTKCLHKPRSHPEPFKEVPTWSTPIWWLTHKRYTHKEVLISFCGPYGGFPKLGIPLGIRIIRTIRGSILGYPNFGKLPYYAQAKNYHDGTSSREAAASGAGNSEIGVYLEDLQKR